MLHCIVLRRFPLISIHLSALVTVVHNFYSSSSRETHHRLIIAKQRLNGIGSCHDGQEAKNTRPGWWVAIGNLGLLGYSRKMNLQPRSFYVAQRKSGPTMGRGMDACMYGCMLEHFRRASISPNQCIFVGLFVCLFVCVCLSLLASACGFVRHFLNSGIFR